MCAIAERGDALAPAVTPKLPAVIGAGDVIAADLAEAECATAMHAGVGEHFGMACRIAKHDERQAQHGDAQRLVLGDFRGERERIPEIDVHGPSILRPESGTLRHDRPVFALRPKFQPRYPEREVGLEQPIKGDAPAKAVQHPKRALMGHDDHVSVFVVDVLEASLRAKRFDSRPKLAQRLAVTGCDVPQVGAPAVDFITGNVVPGSSFPATEVEFEQPRIVSAGGAAFGGDRLGEALTAGGGAREHGIDPRQTIEDGSYVLLRGDGER